MEDTSMAEQNQNLENTVKKMAIVLEKVVKKVDELDQRVKRLEMKVLKEEAEGKTSSTQASTTTAQPQPQPQPQVSSGGGFGGFGTGFLSSLLGSFAGMSLFSLLFNNHVSAEEVAREAGIDDADLEHIEEQLNEIDEKLDEIDEKLEDLDVADADIDTGDFVEPADFDFDDGFFLFNNLF